MTSRDTSRLPSTIWHRALTVALVTAATLSADEWPQWRGPLGTGVSNEKDLPVTWTEKDISWRAALGGVGASSPVVWGDRVFVTAQTGRGARRPGGHPTLARGAGVEAESSSTTTA